MKTTRSSIRQLVRTGLAVDLTTTSHHELENIRQRESGFDRIAYSLGTYGINGKLIRGRETGTLYAVCDRTTNIFHFS